LDHVPYSGAKGLLSRAVLVAVPDPHTTPDQVREHLDELAFLAQTAGLQEEARFVQKLPHPDPRSFVGKGKLEEIRKYVEDSGATSVIFDDDLTPSQLRNLEKEFNGKDREKPVRVYDRSLLILDIFLYRARTAQARTQVELARNQYLLPRLTRMWTHLERQRGGTGARGGAGEKEIETDRRNIRNQIDVLKEQLKKIEKQRLTQRKGRSQSVRVALVGYTNAGKSTLMNLLAKSDVYAEDKLFATVDSTVRKVVIENIPFLLADTVGFIRKLPHHLIESFKSTLDEVREADVLLHVVDVSHPFHENQMEVVHQTLADLGAGGVPAILVLNKIDKLGADDESLKAEHLKNYYVRHGYQRTVFVSAANRENIDELKRVLHGLVSEKYYRIYPNYVKPAGDSAPVER
jgi:GTP-binding protein HflX